MIFEKINLVLLTAAVVVAALMLYDLINVQVKISSTVSECNSYWQKQLHFYCPLAADGKFSPADMINQSFNEPIVMIK